MSQGRFLAAVPLFERAIAIDPNFAMAYYFLGVAFDNAGDVPRSHEYWKKAFRLIDRVSEYERIQIMQYYYRATGELDKAIDAIQLSIRNYPRFWGFPNSLSVIYIDLGQYEEGLKEALEAARLEPNVEHPYRRQLDAYICLDRLREARQLAEKLRGAGARRSEDPSALPRNGLRRGRSGGHRQGDSMVRRQAGGVPQLWLAGGLSECPWPASRVAQIVSASRGDGAAPGTYGTLPPNSRKPMRLPTRSRAIARPCVAWGVLPWRWRCAAMRRGQRNSPRRLRSSFRTALIWNAVQLPAIRAAIALNREEPAKSVELLASAAPYERAYLEAVYLRGLAYLRLHKGTEAAAEFQKVVDHKGANWASGWRHPFWGQFYSPSYLGMARGFALAGDTAKARKAFQDFFELWKDADPDLPILQQAKAEYAKLR